MTGKKSLIQRFDQAGIPLVVLIRLFLGGYFIHAGIVKAGDPIVFLKAVHLYGVLPEQPAFLLNLAAIVLPWLEIVCGIALVVGVYIRGAALNIAVMLALFTPAILARGLAIGTAEGISFFDVKFDCGCGTGMEITWIKICKNSGLFLLAFLALLSQSRRFTLPALLGRVQTAAS